MKLQIPNTSTVVDNPQLVDQSTVVFPDVGDAAAIAKGQLPAGPVRAGTAWQQNPVLYPGGKPFAEDRKGTLVRLECTRNSCDFTKGSDS